jgi:hypothetical protein
VALQLRVICECMQGPTKSIQTLHNLFLFSVGQVHVRMCMLHMYMIVTI